MIAAVKIIVNPILRVARSAIWWQFRIQIIGAVGGVEVDDCPSKDTSSESIEDSGNGTLCSASQEKGKCRGECDCMKDAPSYCHRGIRYRWRDQVACSCDKGIAGDGIKKGNGSATAVTNTSPRPVSYEEHQNECRGGEEANTQDDRLG